jgi:hypothetical protein
MDHCRHRLEVAIGRSLCGKEHRLMRWTRAAFLILTVLAPRESAAQDTGDAIDQVIRSALNLVELRGAIEQMLAQQSATFPLGSSSGAFNWVYNKDGFFERRRSFGPSFAERPSTVGAKQASVSFLYQHTSFRQIAGQALDNIQTVPVHNSRVSVPTTTSLEIGLDRGIVHASYGMSGRVDIGLSLPFGQSRVVGSSQARYVCTAPDEFYCPDGSNRVLPAVSRKGSSWGVGDLMLRTKWNFLSMRSAAGTGDDRVIELAAGGEMRLPTGDPSKLLGRGRSQLQAMLFGSATRGFLSPHFNVGYTFGGKGLECDPTILGNCLPPGSASAVLTSDLGFVQQPSPEINYVFGADAAIGGFTVAADVIGRSLRGAAVFGFYSRDVLGVTGTGFTVARGTVNLVLLGVGAKTQLGNSNLVTFAVLIPMNDNGVKPGIAPSLSFEHSFRVGKSSARGSV